MQPHTIALLTDAALFGLATALVCLAIGLASVAAWQVYTACFSPMAKRRKAFNKRLAAGSAHRRKMLGLPPKR